MVRGAAYFISLGIFVATMAVADMKDFQSPGASLSCADFALTGEDCNEAGTSVAIVSDVNGGGYDDVLIGAPQDDDGGTDSGKVYLFLGSSMEAGAEEYDLYEADFSFVGESKDDAVGAIVACAGDADGSRNDMGCYGGPNGFDQK